MKLIFLLLKTVQSNCENSHSLPGLELQSYHHILWLTVDLPIAKENLTLFSRAVFVLLFILRNIFGSCAYLNQISDRSVNTVLLLISTSSLFPVFQLETHIHHDTTEKQPRLIFSFYFWQHKKVVKRYYKERFEENKHLNSVILWNLRELYSPWHQIISELWSYLLNHNFDRPFSWHCAQHTSHNKANRYRQSEHHGQNHGGQHFHSRREEDNVH